MPRHVSFPGARLVHPPRAARRLIAAAVAATLAGCTPDRTTAPRDAAAFDAGGEPRYGRGTLVDATFIGMLDSAAAAQRIVGLGAAPEFQGRYGIERWSIRYRTLNAHGQPAIASGAVFFPATHEGRLPIVSFSHGTVTVKSNVPSTPATDVTHGIVNAAHGSITVLADYTGLGADSANYHPYLHARAGAASGLDALRAARRLAHRERRQLDGRLFVYGYSQGGQVAMALVREIEQRAPHEFRVTAAAPMSGPYDLRQAALAVLTQPVRLTQNSVNALMAFASFQQIYQVAPSLESLLRSPLHAELGRTLIWTGMPGSVLAASLPTHPGEMLADGVLDKLMTDDTWPLTRALIENDLSRWAPDTPLRLYYGTLDQQVPYAVAESTVVRMRLRGAADVAAVNLGALSHGGAQWPAYKSARAWFDSFAPDGP